MKNSEENARGGLVPFLDLRGKTLNEGGRRARLRSTRGEIRRDGQDSSLGVSGKEGGRRGGHQTSFW